MANILNRGVMSDFDIALNANIENISFDVFDTLLKRNVEKPTDIFDLIQIKLGRKYSNFKDKRIYAEEKARKLHDEVKLIDIYEEYDGIRSDEKKRLLDLELQTEREVLVCNRRLKKFYDKCIKSEKNIYIISDMYLPVEFIETVLENNGIRGYKKIYVSCEYGKSKKKGDLFDQYLLDNGIKSKSTIHIGDSWKADYIVPILKGMRAIHIPRIVSTKNEFNYFKNDKINTNYLFNFLENKTIKSGNKYYEFGYYEFGPFL